MNIIEASIGKKAVEKLLLLMDMFYEKAKENPVFSEEIKIELGNLVLDVLKEAANEKLNPEEAQIHFETADSEDTEDFMQLFLEIYDDEITRRINERNDTKC